MKKHEKDSVEYYLLKNLNYLLIDYYGVADQVF